MIIDFHAHCFPDELAYKAVPSLAKKAGIPYFLNGTIRDIKASMKEAGIDKSIVLPIATKPSQTETINTWASSIQDESIVAFGSIHPEYKYWQEELKRIKQLGLKGIKFHNDYQGIFVDEEKMFPIYEEAFKLDLIMVFHAGLDIGLSGPYHCTPDRLLKVVRAFSGAKIVAAHMGGFRYWDDVERYLVGEDVFLDTSYSLDHMSDEQAERIIKRHGYQKILFATDSPWSDQKQEVGRISRLQLDQKVKKAILGGNAARLLGF